MLLSLDNKTIRDIESVCRKNKILGRENLIEQIQFDNAVLKSLGFSIQDVITNHNNMVLKLLKTNNYLEFTTIDIQNDKVNDIVKAVDDNIDLGTIEETYYNQIDINGQTLQIYCQVTGDCKTCPIDRCFLETTNNNSDNLEYFDKYYYILNVNSGKMMWIPDITMYRADKYGFFNGVSSQFRVDPIAYVELMGMTPKISIEPVETVREYRWRSNGEIGGKIRATDCVPHNYYVFYIYENRTKICIQFKDKEWLEMHKDQVIKICGIKMKITDEYKTGIWYEHIIVNEQFLVKGDTSEENNRIKVEEQASLALKGKMILKDILSMIN